MAPRRLISILIPCFADKYQHDQFDTFRIKMPSCPAVYCTERKKEVAEKQQYVAPADFTFVDVSAKGSGCYLFACFYFCV